MAPVLGTVQGQAYEAHLFFLVLGWSGAGAELSGACPARCPSPPDFNRGQQTFPYFLVIVYWHFWVASFFGTWMRMYQETKQANKTPN